MDMATITMWGVIATAFGAIVAAIALWRKNHLTSVNIAAQALKEFAADRDMQRVFYLIEYERFYYDGKFHQSGMEKRTDKLLRHFAAIALAWKGGFVKTDALRIVRYYVLRILDDIHIQAYMRKVCGDTEKEDPHIREHPYHVLVELGEELAKSHPHNVHVVRRWKLVPGERKWQPGGRQKHNPQLRE